MRRTNVALALAALGLAAAMAFHLLSLVLPLAVRAAADDARVPGQLDDPGVPGFDASGWATDFGISTVRFDEIRSGGPRKDGIPAIDAPRFESIDEARSWLSGRAPVIALELGGEARAYPLAILTWHEIVNDTLGGTPVIVTFCPLCHTALVYQRALGGRILDFGVSGMLRYSDMVMYDRQTESWWQQATGQGIVGQLSGSALTFVPSQIVGLDQFARAHPDGRVLSRDTGHVRDYGRNPYVGYDTADERPYLFEGVVDGRLSPKERVVTLGGPESEAPVSIPLSELRAAGAVGLEFEGQPVVALWQPGAASALDRSVIDESEDVGATGVFSALADGRRLTFERLGGEDAPIRDRQTGSTWDVSGRAVDGPLSGSRLEPVGHADHFWFAWAAFVPHTSIWTPDGLVRLDGGEVDG